MVIEASLGNYFILSNIFDHQADNFEEAGEMRNGSCSELEGNHFWGIELEDECVEVEFLFEVDHERERHFAYNWKA